MSASDMADSIASRGRILPLSERVDPAQAKRGRLRYDRHGRLHPPHSALVLVDLQNDFCDAGGAMSQTTEYLTPIRAAIPRIADLRRQARLR
jgi:hypothetical protein